MYLTKNGVKSHEFAYSTYGELALGEYGEVHFLYNGQFGVMTDGNGLYYMRARYYNPEIRRFINQDIVTGSIENSQSLNRYAYCQGNPVNYLDPFGLEPCEFFSGLGHGMLNLMGLIPGVGDAFDIINAIWYLSEGKVGRAIESGIASLPFIGNLLPETKLFNYTRRALNIVSYGGTGFLAGQGMVDVGQALWAEINSGHCSGWNIALGIANIGLNGATLFFSGKSFVDETKDLNKMLKADGVYDRLYDELLDFHNNNSGFLNPDAFKDIFTKKVNNQNNSNKTYYHVTTEENAQKIIESGELGKRNNNWETRVFAWIQQPTKKQASIAGIGKESQTVIKFNTTASFEPDVGNATKSIASIVVQSTDAQRVPIFVKNVEIVGFKKEWWEFWKK